MKYMVCPHCHTPHLDAGKYAVKLHAPHLCLNKACNTMFDESTDYIGNPLAAFKPELVDGKIILRAHPRSLWVTVLRVCFTLFTTSSSATFLWVCAVASAFPFLANVFMNDSLCNKHHSYKTRKCKPALSCGKLCHTTEWRMLWYIYHTCRHYISC